MNFSRRGWTALCVALLGGCTSSYPVKVDSLAKPDANAVSYVLRNANPSVNEDTVRYREAAGYVKTALSGRGLYEAPVNVVPDMIVDIDYGVSPPKVQREIRTEPVYRTEPSTDNTRRVAVGADAEGRTIYENIPWNVSGQRVKTGDRTYEVVKTTYEKYVRLTAHENLPATEGQPPAEIWTVDVTSEGESKDLRKHLPILVGASIDYIGNDSHGQKSIRIKDSDSDVVFVKKGL